MRILYFADVRFPIERANGIQTMETCAALAARRHEISLIVRPDTAVPARDPFAYYGVPAACGLRIERVAVFGPPIVRRTAYLAQALLRASREDSGSVLFTRDLGLASLFIRLSRFVRAGTVYESHGYTPLVSGARASMLTGGAASSARKQERQSAREQAVWTGADGYVTITRGLADELSERFGPRPRLAVIPDGVRFAAPPEPRPFADPPVVGYAGHLYPWKGVDLLVEALARLDDVHGLIVGGHPKEPDLERVRNLVHERGLESRVRLTGMVDPPRVAELLRQADVLVLPNPAGAVSSRYTSPLKLFEYLAAGRAIVASDLPAFHEVLADGVNALLVEPGRPDALAGRIREILVDRELALRLAQAAAGTAREYSWERRAERLEALLDEVRQARNKTRNKTTAHVPATR